MLGIGTIRYLLALAVLSLHADFVTFEVAQIAVLTFFFLSGFLMERSLPHYSSGIRFLLNRLLRLLPTFLAVAMTTAIIIMATTDDFRRAFGYLYLRSAAGYGSESPIPLRAVGRVEWDGTVPYLGFDSELVPQAWSIGNEMVYYLTVPLLGLLTLRLIGAITLVSATFLCYQLLIRIDDFDYLLYTNLIATYLFFLIGYLAAHLLRRGREGSERLMRISRIVTVLLIGGTYWIDFPDVISPLLVILATALLSGLITIGFLIRSREGEGFISRSLGKISYPLYLSHMIAIGILNYFSILTLPWLLIMATAIAFSFHLIVERPIERLRDRVRG